MVMEAVWCPCDTPRHAIAQVQASLELVILVWLIDPIASSFADTHVELGLWHNDWSSR